MALATAEAIRDRIYTLIEGLTPATDATKFRRYRNEWGADFIAAAESNPAAMLRRFQVREVSDDEPPITTGVIEERVTVRYQVLIAYPQSHRYGRDNAVDRDDVMNEDWKAINFKVGIYGRGNFSTSTAGSYDATPLGAVRDMERGDGVDLLVIDVPFEFYRATGVEAAEPEPTWSVDAVSGVAVPADATEWDAFTAANSLSIATPDSLWLCQESAGDLADSIGSLTLASNGAPSYQQSVSGWDRTGVSTPDGSSMTRFVASSGNGPSPATTSQLWLWFVLTPSAAPAAARDICGLYGSTPTTLRVSNAGGVPRFVSDGTTVNGSVAFDGLVQPLVVRYDRTNSRTVAYTASEKLTGTYAGTTTDGNKGIGDGPATAAGVTYLYGAMWSGADAEVSDADLKALLEAMGWTVSWS